jgi:ketosteroid isomerase-like protein
VAHFVVEPLQPVLLPCREPKGETMSTETTRDVVTHHLAVLGGGDLEAIMSDYADDAVMVTNLGGVTRGADALRAVFGGIPAGMFDGFAILAEHYDGEVGYVTWSTPSIAFGTDTFVVHDGRITVQSAAMHFG